MNTIPSYSQAYFNGQYLPLNEISVSPFDRGFLFGDGVYEVVVSYRGKPFYLDYHLERLRNSLSFCRLSIDVEIAEVVAALFKSNEHLGETVACYLQITRGVDFPRRHEHPVNAVPTIFAYCYAPICKTVEHKKKGISLKTTEDIRWQHCDVKAITLLPNGLAKQEAIDLGFSDSLQVRGDEIKETSSGNIFFVRDGALFTPEPDNQILHGVTRRVIRDIAQAEGLDVIETKITVDQLSSFSAVFLCSTLQEITPVTKIDNIEYPLDLVLFQQLQSAFDCLK